MWISPKTLYLILFLKPFLCCDCSSKNKESKIRKYEINDIISENNNTKNINLEKRQLDFEEELMIDPAVSETSTVVPDSVIIDTTMNPIIETSTDYDSQSTEINVDDDKIKKCPRYNKGAEFDLNIMADVWENSYYQMQQKLTCFRIHLKMLTIQEQKNYEKIYGNFNNIVQWDKCILEVKSGPKKNAETKKHFLQGTTSDKGVLDNIIILEDFDDKTTTITLREENPDQWLIVKDLLLMRDCDDGDIVVFARVPFQPRREDIIDALAIFGEDKPNGTFGCAGDDIRSSTFISDSDDLFT